MERMPPLRIPGSRRKQPPRNQNYKFRGYDELNQNIEPSAYSQVAVGIVEQIVSEFIDAILIDSQSNKSAAYQKSDTPDPILVYKKIDT
jgi:hypothetical protein